MRTNHPTPKLLSFETAKSFNENLFPEVIACFAEWLRHFREFAKSERTREGGDRWESLCEAAEIATQVGVATFSMRYGVGSKLSTMGFRGYDCLYYHNTQHALDIIQRLDKVCDHYGSEEFPPQRRLLLMLFALFHDLRQQEVGGPVNGVGLNEWQTVAEAIAIINSALIRGGFDPKADKALFEYFARNFTWMISGTTFGFFPREEAMNNPFNGEPGHYTVPIGALAPLVVQQLKEAKPNWKSDADLEELADNVLLGADVDTANVSDSFYDFASQGVNLCREIEKRKGALECEPNAVYSFMTGGQEYYFHKAQKFNSRFSEAVFGEEKEKNGLKLAHLTRQIRKTFGNPRDGLKTLELNGEGVDGDLILREYLVRARDLSS